MIIYINKEDPRLFVYKHQKWKWMGITLNFAHSKSLVLLCATLASAFIPFIPLLVIHNTAAKILSAILFLFWFLALLCFYYRQASKDLQRYPGPLSTR